MEQGMPNCFLLGRLPVDILECVMCKYTARWNGIGIFYVVKEAENYVDISV